MSTQSITALQVNFPGGRQILVRYPASPMMDTVVRGVFAATDYPRLNCVKGADAVVVDLGANIGASAILFSAQYPTAVVYALEPARIPSASWCRTRQPRSPIFAAFRSAPLAGIPQRRSTTGAMDHIPVPFLPEDSPLKSPAKPWSCVGFPVSSANNPSPTSRCSRSIPKGSGAPDSSGI